MKWKKSGKKRGVPVPLLTMILAVVTLTMGVLTAFTYGVFRWTNNNMYLDYFIQNQAQMIGLAFQNIDQQIIQSVFGIPQLYFSNIPANQSLLKLQEGMPSPSETRAFGVEMNRMEKAYPFLESVDIYYENSGVVVTGFRDVHFPQTKEWFDRYLPWYESWLKEDCPGFISCPNGVYATKKPILTYVSKVTTTGMDSDIILAFHISTDSFGSYLSEETGKVSIYTKSGQILYDTPYESEEAPASISANTVLSCMARDGLGKKGEPFSMTVGTDHITIFPSQTMDSGLCYLYRMDTNRLYQQYYGTKRIFQINFLMVLGLNVLVLVWISCYYYNAYRKRVLRAAKRAGISEEEKVGFDKSLDRLVHEVVSLHTTISSSKGFLFQGMIRSLLLNKGDAQVSEELAPYMEGAYVQCLFFYPREGDGKQSAEQLQETFAVGQQSFHVLFTTMEKVSLVAVLFFDEGEAETLPKAFALEVQKFFGPCQIVVGRSFPKEDGGIEASYHSTLEAEKYRFVFPKEQLLAYEELRLEVRKESGNHLRLFELMERDMRSDDRKSLKTRLEELVISFQFGNYSIKYCYSTLQDLVTLLYRFMQQSQVDSRVLFGYDIREYAREIGDIQEFLQWILFVSETILEAIRRQRSLVDQGEKERIICFIDENLEKDVTLDGLAETLGWSSDAASRYFRQIMETGYTDYIRERKLDRAMELLQEGYSVKEIADRLGYSSSQYFIKVFKGVYGITPHQYKKEKGW